MLNMLPKSGWTPRVWTPRGNDVAKIQENTLGSNVDNTPPGQKLKYVIF